MLRLVVLAARMAGSSSIVSISLLLLLLLENQGDGDQGGQPAFGLDWKDKFQVQPGPARPGLSCPGRLPSSYAASWPKTSATHTLELEHSHTAR